MARSNSLSVAIVQMADVPCVRLRKVAYSFTSRNIAVLYVGCRRGREGVSQDGIEFVRIPPGIPSGSLIKVVLAPFWILLASLYLRMLPIQRSIYAADFEAGMAAFLSGRPYVYDVLDTYADRYKAPKILLEYLRFLENLVARRATALVHVDQVRLNTLREHPTTLIVRNLPVRKDIPGDEHKADEFDVIASGNLNAGRGVDQLLLAAKQVRECRLLLLGRMSHGIRSQLEKSETVVVRGYASSAESLRLSARSRAIFAAYDPTSSINRLACPNKFYDAIVCGVPIIINEEVQLAAVVKSEGLGWTFKFGDVPGLANILKSVISCSPEYLACVERVRLYRHAVPGWDEEFAPVAAVTLELGTKDD